jgi:predicted HD phosphohydrolase
MSLNLQDISSLLNSRATTWYGQEAVSQLEHALQCAQLAEKANETPETVVAALLHDLGSHLDQREP